MPVVVTGAECPLGRAVVLALRAQGRLDVRATVRDPAARSELGVPVAVSDLEDPRRFGAVLEGAHTVVHLDPAPLAYVIDAAEGTSVRRIVLVAAHDPAQAVPAGLEVVVVRPDTAAVLEADRRRSPG